MRFCILALVAVLVGCGTTPPTVREGETKDAALELARELREGDIDAALDRFLLARGMGAEREAWIRGLVAEELRGFIEVMGVDEQLEPVPPRFDLVREGVVLARRISPPRPRHYFYVGKSVHLTRDGAMHLVVGFVCHRGTCRVSEVSWGVPDEDRDGLQRLRAAHEAAVAGRWDFLQAHPRPD